MPIILIIGIILILVLLTSIVELLGINAIKKNISKDDIENIRKIEKKLTYVKRTISISTIILANMINFIVLYYFLEKNFIEEIETITFFIITAIVSIILIFYRLKKNGKFNKRISILLGVIIIILIIVNPIRFIVVDNYNKNFEKFCNIEESYGKCTSNIKGLIEKVKSNNNRSLNKIIISFDNENYQTEDELETLVENIDFNKVYYIEFKYNHKFISSINVKSHMSNKMYITASTIESYQGENVEYIYVRALLSQLVSAFSYKESDLEANVILYSDKYGIIETKINKNESNINDILKSIKQNNTYDVKIRCEENTAFVYITEN